MSEGFEGLFLGGGELVIAEFYILEAALAGEGPASYLLAEEPPKY